jgi:cyclophilin family peptidyl-prolyl cis-trans isomerase
MEREQLMHRIISWHLLFHSARVAARQRGLVATAVVLVLTTAVSCAGDQEPSLSASEKPTPRPTAADKAKKDDKPSPDNPQVILETSMGTIRLELFKDKAPITVKNFLDYVDAGFYDGTIYHRVIPNFMIQGGGFTPDMKQKPTRDPIKNEAGNGVSNERGTIAMARTGVVDSATAQFFINVVDNAMLDHRDNSPRGFGYCVFGRVIEGMDVVDKIRAVKTHSASGHDDVPVETVLIKSAKRVEAQK